MSLKPKAVKPKEPKSKDDDKVENIFEKSSSSIDVSTSNSKKSQNAHIAKSTHLSAVKLPESRPQPALKLSNEKLKEDLNAAIDKQRYLNKKPDPKPSPTTEKTRSE